MPIAEDRLACFRQTRCELPCSAGGNSRWPELLQMCRSSGFQLADPDRSACLGFGSTMSDCFPPRRAELSAAGCGGHHARLHRQDALLPDVAGSADVPVMVPAAGPPPYRQRHRRTPPPLSSGAADRSDAGSPARKRRTDKDRGSDQETLTPGAEKPDYQNYRDTPP